LLHVFGPDDLDLHGCSYATCNNRCQART
jgi:hypothetical protein